MLGLRQPPGKDGEAEATEAVLRMQILGARPAPQAVGRDELPGTVNYLVGNDPARWRTNVPTYGKVAYEEVYPGVDLVYYGNQRQLEYDFIVAPGADPGTIRLGFQGAESVELDDRGDLVVQTPGGEVRLQRPLIYQEVDGVRREIRGAYLLEAGHQVAFRVSTYDETRPLVIDPVLVYSTFLGGSAQDRGDGIAVDAAGSAYVVGSAASTNFPAVTPTQATNAGGPSDIFVAKLNPSGSALVYATYLGGGGDDVGLGIALDAQGNAYVTGRTTSANFPTMNPFQSAFGGGVVHDAFVAKLSAAGGLVYSTYLGGSNFDEAEDIAVDASGNAYVTGNTISTNFPTTNPCQATNRGSRDIFVAKLNPSGNGLIYSTYLGGGGDDGGTGIAVDSAGNAYLTGVTRSTNFPTLNPIQPARGGDPSVTLRDAFVAKLNASGSALVYATYLGGAGEDQGADIAVDGAGNAFVVGSSESTDFPTANALQPAFGGPVPLGTSGGDAFVAMLNAAGNALVYSTYLGGNDGEFGAGIALDAAGNAYVTGGTFSPNFPTVNAVQPNRSAANQEAFVAKVNSAGSALAYATYLGGSGNNDAAFAIAVDGAGNAYVTGLAGSANFPTRNPLQPACTLNAGGFCSNDAFVTKIGEASSDVTAPVIAVSLAPAPNASGWSNAPTVTLSWSVSDPESGIATSSGCESMTVTEETAGATRTCLATNGAGLATSESGTVRIDRTAPTITGARAPQPNANGWHNADVTVSFTCGDALSGVDTCPAPTTLSSDGADQSVTRTATDRAGNAASATVGGINVDKTPPTLSGAATTLPNADGWYRGDVIVSWTCGDALSGIDGGCPANSTVTGEGANLSAGATVSDRASNATSATVGGLKIDRTAPTTTAAAPSGWSGGGVTVTLSATDNLSGVKATYFVLDGGAQQTGTSVAVDAEGIHTLQFWSEDRAGNGEAPNTVQVRIDRSAPTISHIQAPPPNASGWNNTDVTVTFVCGDSLSGIASCTGPRTVTTEGRLQAVSGTIVDNAGNSATHVATVSIDTTPPSIAGAVTTQPNTSGWYKAGVTVHFTCADTLAGIATCPADVVLANEGANQGTGGSTTDAAGNSSNTTVADIHIDLTAPSVAYAGNVGTYTVDQTIAITCTATDSLSGLALTTCQNISGPAHTFSLGTNTFSASATDKAGNVGNGSTSFAVQVSPAGIDNLIGQFVTDPDTVAQLRQKVGLISTAPNATSKANRVDNFEKHVNQEVGKTLTREQADILIRLARAL